MNISDLISLKKASIMLCLGDINACERAQTFIDLDESANFKFSFQSLKTTQSGTVMLMPAEAKQLLSAQLQAYQLRFVQLEKELAELYLLANSQPK